jgi:diguanylate cyclase
MTDPRPHRYSEDTQRCTEILRTALPQMTRQNAGAHPVSYAIWFEHVAGLNPGLSQSLLERTRGGRLLDEATTAALYQEHVVDVVEKQNLRAAEGLRRVMSTMADSAREAGAETSRYGQSLGRLSQQAQQESVSGELLRELIEQTQQMQQAVGTLSQRLETSQKEIEALRAEVNRARGEALADGLTGLANRRSFDRAMEQALAMPKDEMALLVADIDWFKRINDTYGHPFGDTVLRVVAQAIQGCLSGDMLLARVGGEEFAVLAPGMGRADAQMLAEKIRNTVAASRIKRKDQAQPIGSITLSLGVALWSSSDTAESWFERADRALYISKAAGRNRVTLSADAAASPAAASTEAAASAAAP